MIFIFHNPLLSHLHNLLLLKFIRPFMVHSQLLISVHFTRQLLSLLTMLCSLTLVLQEMWKKVLKLHFETKYCVSCSCDSPRNSSTSIWQQTPITIVKVNLFKQLSRGRPQNDKFIVCCRDTLTFQSYFCRTIWHHVSYQQ